MDVILIHDAAIDEYMATVLLTTMPGIDLLGIVVVNADCIAAPAMQTAWKILEFVGRCDIPLALSGARGLNPFPWAYRTDCIKQGEITALAWVPQNPHWPPFPDGDTLLEQLLEKAAAPVTLLVTCPLTPVSDLLRRRLDLIAKVKQIVWMGGAIHVAGNIDSDTVPTPPANSVAEWNAFWDPEAVDWIFRNLRCPIVEFPLDITNRAKVAPAFLDGLDQQATAGCRYSQLALQSYGIVAQEAFYDMWDVVTACWLVNGTHVMFKPPETLKLRIDTSLERYQGGIREVPEGREVDVVLDFLDDGRQFYEYVLGQLKR